MNGSELICQILESKDTKYIFGLFGDIQTDFAHAIEKSKIEWVGVHNEKSGGFMADIYARVSGKPGVVFTTLGPGATNLTTALANATQDRSPLVAISDQSPISDCKLGVHQFIDFEKAFHADTGITKASFLVKSVEELPEILDQAFNLALTEPKGAVHVSVPSDLFGEKVLISDKNSKLKLQQITNPKGLITFDKLVKKLYTKRPGLVLAGGSIERSKSEISFLKFIENFGLPVLTTFRGKNAIPSNHPQYIGTLSRHLKDVLDKILVEVDYVLTIGFDYNEGIKPKMWSDKVPLTLNIDCYDNRIKEIFTPQTLIADLNSTFEKLSSKKSPIYKSKPNLRSLHDKVENTVKRELKVNNEYLSPERIIDAVNTLYAEDSVIICDIGLNKYYSGLLLKSTKSNQIIFSNGMSTMAFTSGAVGAKFAEPEKDVVALVGDGGFLMDLQEIITAAQNKCPVVWIIFNNGGLGLVEQAQYKKIPNGYGVKFDKVTFQNLAKVFNLYGRRIERGDDMLKIIKRAKKMKIPSIIDVPVEYNISF